MTIDILSTGLTDLEGKATIEGRVGCNLGGGEFTVRIDCGNERGDEEERRNGSRS